MLSRQYDDSNSGQSSCFFLAMLLRTQNCSNRLEMLGFSVRSWLNGVNTRSQYRLFITGVLFMVVGKYGKQLATQSSKENKCKGSILQH